jgi:CBS domain-containing protein
MLVEDLHPWLVVAHVAGGASAPCLHSSTLAFMAELTERALASRVPNLLDQPLKVVGRRDPVAVRPGTSLAECLTLVSSGGASDSVFVTDDANQLVGVLAERDIFGRIVGSSVDLSGPVEPLLTTNPRTLELEQPIRVAVELMQTGRYRNVPVVDAERHLVGVIRPQDILTYLAESFPQELLNLPPVSNQHIEEPEGA